MVYGSLLLRNTEAYHLSLKAWQKGGLSELRQAEEVRVSKCQCLGSYCPQSQGLSLAALHLLRRQLQSPWWE